MTETLHDLATDTVGILQQIRGQIEPLILWSRKQAIYSDDHEEGAFAHAYGMAAKAASEIEDLAGRFDKALGASDTPGNGAPLQEAADDGGEGEDDRDDWPDKMNPFVDSYAHETLQNVIEGIRLIQHSLYRKTLDEAREVRFSSEQWHGLHRHCQTLILALQHEIVWLAEGRTTRAQLVNRDITQTNNLEAQS